MTEDDLPVLWQLRFSHFNEKGRWALDYKQVPHRRRSLVPGRHSLRSKRLGGQGTTPILVLDREVIGDTTEIVAKLEQRNPDPPLYPDTEIERKAALDWRTTSTGSWGRDCAARSSMRCCRTGGRRSP